MYQKIMLIGNLGNEPEMRYMQDGTAVTNFSLATNRRWKDRVTGEDKEEVCWWRVSVWGRQAETVTEYLKKGSKVFVEGQMKPDPASGGPRTYARNDGTVGASYELRAFNIKFLSGKDDDYTAGAAVDQKREVAVEEDEIPF